MGLGGVGSKILVSGGDSHSHSTQKRTSNDKWQAAPRHTDNWLSHLCRLLVIRRHCFLAPLKRLPRQWTFGLLYNQKQVQPSKALGNRTIPLVLACGHIASRTTCNCMQSTRSPAIASCCQGSETGTLVVVGCGEPSNATSTSRPVLVSMCIMHYSPGGIRYKEHPTNHANFY
jgi:hypothetical protein